MNWYIIYTVQDEVSTYHLYILMIRPGGPYKRLVMSQIMLIGLCTETRPSCWAMNKKNTVHDSGQWSFGIQMREQEEIQSFDWRSISTWNTGTGFQHKPTSLKKTHIDETMFPRGSRPVMWGGERDPRDVETAAHHKDFQNISKTFPNSLLNPFLEIISHRLTDNC